MARPPKLTPEQRADIDRRRVEGESFRSIAKDFGVDESTVRANVSPHAPQVRETAAKIADARAALADLPPTQQHQAINLADKLRSISTSLAEAASLGAATAHTLQRHASRAAAQIDKAPTPAAAADSLRTVQALTKVANEASHIGLNLLAANKERVKAADDLPLAAPGAMVPVFNITLAGE